MNDAIGVLGLGSIGLRHASNLVTREEAVVGFDPDPVRGAMLAKLGGRQVNSVDELLASSRALVIASPNDRHLDDMKRAIHSGLHCFVEKPLAHRLEGISELLAEARRKRLVVLCGFNLRFHPCVAAIRERLDGGRFGDPIRAQIECASYLPDWRPDSDYRKGYAASRTTGGVVFDIIHEIDVALHLFGPARVAAASAYNSGRLEIASDDIADFVLRHRSGVSASIHLDYITRPAVRRTRVVGTDGVLEADLNARTLTWLSITGEVLKSTTYSGTYASDYQAEMDAFLAGLDGAVAEGATGEDGLRALEIALSVRGMAGLPRA